MSPVETQLTIPAKNGYTHGKVTEAETGEETILTWRIHRLASEPKKIPLVAGGYAVALLLWRTIFPQPLALFLPVFALTSALAEYLFPVEYRLTSKGAYLNCGPAQKLFLAWEDIRRATRGSDGVYLSSLKLPSRLDNFRGIRLRFVNGNDAEVIAAVKSLWKPEESAA